MGYLCLFIYGWSGNGVVFYRLLGSDYDYGLLF